MSCVSPITTVSFSAHGYIRLAPGGKRPHLFPAGPPSAPSSCPVARVWLYSIYSCVAEGTSRHAPVFFLATRRSGPAPNGSKALHSSHTLPGQLLWPINSPGHTYQMGMPTAARCPPWPGASNIFHPFFCSFPYCHFP